MTFANEFKELRTELNLTQSALSKKYQIPIRTIQDWEAEKRTPPKYVQLLLLNELKRIKAD